MQSERFFAQFEMFGIKLGLDTMSKLLALLGNPEKLLRFIHVAGTNGKGSVCAMTEHALRASGYKTGFYSSPHLERLHERFRINGVEVSEENLCDAIRKLALAIEKNVANHGVTPTYFEVTTLLAILIFAEAKCDFILWETGMGGRFDATNVVEPIITVITSISMDHQAYLGDTLEKIAFEKAGIIKYMTPCFSSIQPPEVVKVLDQVANEKSTHVTYIQKAIDARCVKNDCGKVIGQLVIFPEVEILLPLAGKWQLINVQLVYQILCTLAKECSFMLKDALKSLEKVSWGGRFEYLHDDMIIDGAHNFEAAKLLVETFQTYYPAQKVHILFANFADKDTTLIIDEFQKIAQSFVFTSLTGAKGRKSISGKALEQMVYVSSETYDNTAHAIDVWQCKKGLKLAAGSLYLVGELKKNVKKI